MVVRVGVPNPNVESVENVGPEGSAIAGIVGTQWQLVMDSN